MVARVQKPKPLLKAALVGAVAIVALAEAPPFWVAGYDAIQIASFGGLIFAGPPLLAAALLKLADWIDRVEARIPSGAKDAASFAKSIRYLKGRAKPWQAAPYWGTLRGKGVFGDVKSGALILGPAGVFKDVSHAGPNLCALASKGAGIVCMDLKADMAVIYGPMLEKLGYEVVYLNYGGLFSDRVEGSSYNPLSLLVDSLTQGSLSDVSADATEMALQIYAEPKSEGEGGNKFFRNGSRKIIVFAMVVLVLIEGEDATLGGVLTLIQDRDLLLQYAQWAAGTLTQADGTMAKLPIHESGWVRDGGHDPDAVQRFADYIAGMGASLANLMDTQDSRTFDSFIEGAIGEMADFNATSRNYHTTQSSDFRFRHLKENKRPMAVFMMGDTSRPDAHRKNIEIATSNMFKELMRTNASRRKVYVFANEVTNYIINRISTLQTTLRVYGCVVFYYVQSLAAYKASYSANDLQTLLSETEVKYILAGQRDPETLKMLEELMGKKKVVKRSNSGNRRDNAEGLNGMDGYSYSEEAVPLMSADQIRRCEKGILLLGRNKPALIDTPSIAAIWPFRHWQGISPFYGKPYRERIKLILWRFVIRDFRRLMSKLRSKS